MSVLCLALSSCVQSGPEISEAEAKAIISKIHMVYEKAVPEKDLETIMTLYEDKATYLPFQHVILSGKAEIAQAWQRTFTYPVISFDLETVSVKVNDDLIHEVGRTHSIFDFQGQHVPGEFKYLNVWRRQSDGEYKIYLATYNQWMEPSEAK